MNTQTQTHVENQLYKVYTTKNYDLFKVLNGNRDINSLNVRRLVASFEKQYLFSPILCNEKMEIIDGQHRYLAAKKLNQPINYIIVKGYGLKEVQILNTNSANWKKVDYLKAYCDLGVDAYLLLNKFMEDFPDFGIASAEQLLTNLQGGMNNKGQVSGKLFGEKARGKAKNFEEGKLEIFNIKLAYDYAEKIMMFKPFYDGYNRAVFVGAMIGIFKNKHYNHNEMIHKISNQPSALTHCTNVTQYRLLLEEIYNFRRREKINLRF